MPQAFAKIIEAAIGRVIGKRENGDRIPADQRGADRSPGEDRCLSALEHRGVTALRQIDDQLVGATLLAVVGNEFCAQSPRLHTNDRVGARIEAVFLPEHLHADDVFLQFVLPSGNRLEDDEAEEALEAVALLKGCAGKNARKLVAHRLSAVSSRRGPRSAARHSSYLTT